ncbi:MAG: TlpA family protein disulfide reductase [Candidatus Wildermuthbacteria bacterium]|nr:TlpA family protein disulfide reductase [Candidatus Wildermuthbacteria bacterium]
MNKIIIIAIVLSVALVGGILLLSSRTSESAGSVSQEAEKVLALSFKDYQGNTVALSQFVNKPLVVNAWAAWCPFCREELKDFASVQKELGEQVVIIAIDRAESLETAKRYSDQLGVTNDLVFLLDPSDSFYQTIGGFSMPETIFIDKTGVIRDHKRGPMNTEEIRQRIQKIL